MARYWYHLHSAVIINSCTPRGRESLQKLPVLYFFKYLGMDRIVRLWNPYVPQKPTAFLRGHNSPIAFIAIAGEDNRLFSISIDKCVKVLYDC